MGEPGAISAVATKLIGSPPDILDCIAALSNDEVPTPPWLADAMLDLLPGQVWQDPSLRWLDPGTKSGVFLREVARRLMHGVPVGDPRGRTATAGLTEAIRDEDERRLHIFRHMLFGMAITDLCGDMSRRSLYYTTDPTSDWSVVPLQHPEGNLRFIPARHSFPRRGEGACSLCGAPAELERGDRRENYAYSFLHHQSLPEGFPMQFDVIVGNPPYQIGVAGNSRTKPIYHLFVEKAIAMAPRYVLMITPTRWTAGGLGLDSYRRRMLADTRLRTLVDYPNVFECFPDAKIDGGVSYFLWDRDHAGPCEVSVIRDGVHSAPMRRALGEFDVLVRDNEALPILRKALALDEQPLSHEVTPQKPFGLQSNYVGARVRSAARPVSLHGSKGLSFVSEDELTMNKELVRRHKVFVSEAYGESSGPYQVIGSPIVVGPGSACTQTYLAIGAYDSEAEASYLAAFLRTKFVRFLISLRKITQHTKPSTYAFVPSLPMDREWTDDELYERYGLTDDEVAFVEGRVKQMDSAEARARKTSGATGDAP